MMAAGGRERERDKFNMQMNQRTYTWREVKLEN